MSEIGAQAGGIAAPLGIMVTEGRGGHPPQKWATLTGLELVSIDPSIDPARRDAAIGLRRRIADVLLDQFKGVRTTSSSAELDQAATVGLESIQALAAGTPWEASFKHPEIAAAMLATIRRNLFSAADIALQVE